MCGIPTKLAQSIRRVMQQTKQQFGVVIGNKSSNANYPEKENQYRSARKCCKNIINSEQGKITGWKNQTASIPHCLASYFIRATCFFFFALRFVILRPLVTRHSLFCKTRSYPAWMPRLIGPGPNCSQSEPSCRCRRTRQKWLTNQLAGMGISSMPLRQYWSEPFPDLLPNRLLPQRIKNMKNDNQKAQCFPRGVFWPVKNFLVLHVHCKRK